MFMVLSSWLSHFESSPGFIWWIWNDAKQPPTFSPGQTTQDVSLPVGCQKPHPPSPFIIITQLESWYLFCHLTEGRRLSRPRHCSKGVQPVPKAVYGSGFYAKHATAHGEIATLVITHRSQARYRWTTATCNSSNSAYASEARLKPLYKCIFFMTYYIFRGPTSDVHQPRGSCMVNMPLVHCIYRLQMLKYLLSMQFNNNISGVKHYYSRLL